MSCSSHRDVGGVRTLLFPVLKRRVRCRESRRSLWQNPMSEMAENRRFGLDVMDEDVEVGVNPPPPGANRNNV